MRVEGPFAVIRGKFLVQPLGLGKALVGVDVAHLDAFLKPVHGFCGEESPLSDRQAVRTIPGQPQADVGIVQNVFFVLAQLPGTAVVQPSDGFVGLDVAVAVHVAQLVGGGCLAQYSGRLPVVASQLLVALYAAPIVIAVAQVAHGG